MPRSRTRLAAGAVAAVLAFAPAACSDEDGDGAVTDEEVDELEETGEDAGNELEQEVEEGGNETEDDE